MVTTTEERILAPAELYPFEHHYLDLNGLKYHYLDEGQGDPVVMVHGNPTWSFYYRNLAKALSKTHRVIVPDHIGCGHSDIPDDADYDYTLSRRVADLESLLSYLEIDREITLVVHDWGGMIGSVFATRYPERIKRMVVMNTSAFKLPETKMFPWALWLVRDTHVGSLLVRGFNAFSAVATRVCCKRRTLPAAVRKAYRAPYDTWHNRIATLRFVQDIPLREGDPAWELVTSVEENAPVLADKPMLICWGLKDFVFDHHFLKCWEDVFPDAEVHRFEDCGHYVLEDAAEEIEALVTDFIART